MFVAVTHVKLKPNGRKEIMKITSREHPDIRNIPGFVAYYVVSEPGEDYTTVAIFEDPGGWHKWQEMSKANPLAKEYQKHLAGPPENAVTVSHGHVVYSRTAR